MIEINKVQSQILSATELLGSYKLDNYIFPRALEYTSYLTFLYPKNSADKNDYVKLKIPMYENIMIQESKKANYVSYLPISRASNLFTYLGSEAREFKVEFNITLPHIEHYYNSYINKVKFNNTSDLIEAKKQFF